MLWLHSCWFWLLCFTKVFGVSYFQIPFNFNHWSPKYFVLFYLFVDNNNDISEDLTVDSSASSSLIHMSVVDSGPGVRRSSVVVIEHVPEVQGEEGDLEDEEIQTHIFV